MEPTPSTAHAHATDHVTAQVTAHAGARTTTTGAAGRPVCGERAYLRPETALAAGQLAPDPALVQPSDIERHLRCTLEQHGTGDHYAFVMDLDGVTTGSVWTRWNRGHAPTVVLVQPDCPGTSPDPRQEPCCEFADHPGGHTWQLADPWRAAPDPRR
jgi:hypothetical protein